MSRGLAAALVRHARATLRQRSLLDRLCFGGAPEVIQPLRRVGVIDGRPPSKLPGKGSLGWAPDPRPVVFADAADFLVMQANGLVERVRQLYTQVARLEKRNRR
jgi:hypothetical protein